ncbi:MAG: efflux RND transporter permease subunit, partial [Ignavibacteria bacterium]|nr:efflux RND transporter permease subunit [Ignavibacteria bacterium]
ETNFHCFRSCRCIIYLFLRDWRSTFIPVIAIPVSIITSFFLMDLVSTGLMY